VWTFGRGSAADDADAVGAGVDDTATVGAGLADDEAVAGGLGISDGPAVHAMRRNAMAATCRPKPRLIAGDARGAIGGGLGDGPESRDRDQCDRQGDAPIAVPVSIHLRHAAVRLVGLEPPVAGSG
jgi:hypothetical protein